MPLDHKNKNGEYFSNFEFFWNKIKEEWVIIFGSTSYELNLWYGPVDASYTDCERVGIVTVGRGTEILFTRRNACRDTVSFLNGLVTTKEKKDSPEDIFDNPRLAEPLAEFASASKKMKEITKEIGYPTDWADDENMQFYQYGGEEAAEKLKEHLLIVAKNKDKKKEYWDCLRLAKEAEDEIKRVFRELTQ